MKHSISTRQKIWQGVLGRDPCVLVSEDLEWLKLGAVEFSRAVWDALARGTAEADLIEDLAVVLNIFASNEIDDPGDNSCSSLRVESVPSHDLAAEAEEGMSRLVQACLRPRKTGAPTKLSKNRQLNAIQATRSVLLRVKNGDTSPRRFPKWVQDKLLDFVLNEVWNDVVAYTDGKPARARDLALMLAANYAAIRSLQHKARFIDLLKRLCHRSEDYVDPFLLDLVFIAQRITRPGDIDEVVRITETLDHRGGK